MWWVVSIRTACMKPNCYVFTQTSTNNNHTKVGKVSCVNNTRRQCPQWAPAQTHTQTTLVIFLTVGRDKLSHGGGHAPTAFHKLDLWDDDVVLQDRPTAGADGTAPGRVHVDVRATAATASPDAHGCRSKVTTAWKKKSKLLACCRSMATGQRSPQQTIFCVIKRPVCVLLLVVNDFHSPLTWNSSVPPSRTMCFHLSLCVYRIRLTD